MLTIRDAQIEVFRQRNRGRFVEQMLAHIREFWPAQSARFSDGEVRESVRKGLQQAESYGVVLEYDVARFVVLMYALGFEYDQMAIPRAILNDSSISGRRKVDELWRCALDAFRKA
jgi:hypothetical protein